MLEFRISDSYFLIPSHTLIIQNRNPTEFTKHVAQSAEDEWCLKLKAYFLHTLTKET